MNVLFNFITHRPFLKLNISGMVLMKMTCCNKLEKPIIIKCIKEVHIVSLEEPSNVERYSLDQRSHLIALFNFITERRFGFECIGNGVN